MNSLLIREATPQQINAAIMDIQNRLNQLKTLVDSKGSGGGGGGGSFDPSEIEQKIQALQEQLNNLAEVARSGSYNDLKDKPVIPVIDYPVTSVNSKTGAVTLNASDVGALGVNNAAIGVKDYNDGNRTIQIGYAGDGLNTGNLNYIAGYTDNGTKIKDVSKDVLNSWLNTMQKSQFSVSGDTLIITL